MSTEVLDKLRAALPAWHFEPYGTEGAVACFPPGRRQDSGTWSELSRVAFIDSVCGPIYVVTKMREGNS